MTALEDATGWLASRPRVRSALRVGPRFHLGAQAVHFVGDQDTGAFFRVGEREAFLIGRLDGEHSLAEIGEQYAQRFGARLGEQNWQQLFTMLGTRGLLDPVAPQRLAGMRAAADEQRRTSGRTLYLWRVPVPGLAERVPVVARWTGWLLNAALMLPLSLAGLIVTGWVVLHLGMLSEQVRSGGFSWPVAGLAFAVAWAAIAAHEFAHGVACVRYGGRPLEMGVMWRFPLIAPYCKVDDVMTFPRRRDRVVTAFAGIYLNLIAMLAYLLLWRFGPQDGFWSVLAADLLLIGAVTVVANLVPVLQLDGYQMLEHATGTVQLQTSSIRFLAAGGLRARPRRLVVLYGAYALLSVAILAPAVVLTVRYWWITLADLTGPVIATVALVCEAVALFALVGWVNRRRGRSAVAG